MSKFAVNIGLEVHIQLNTKSKAFCSDSTTFGQPANTNISAISLAYPGALPRINEEQIEKAVTLALALNCEIIEHNYFDRKSYFYPDLPKGYQITQDNAPYCNGGYLDIEVNGKSKRVLLNRIHMEEDAGKSIHDLDPRHTMIDLNRAGTPLLELVTEPFIESADEAYAFLSALRSLVRYLGISDGNMEEGSMRADCNVSLRPIGQEEMGERREVKNVNSLRFAKKAIEYEIKAQANIINSGGTVSQSTMDYNPELDITIPLRDKEDAHDYRFFPDPDLPPLQLTEAYVDNIKASMPADPREVEQQLLSQYRMNRDQAKTFTYDLELRRHFEQLASRYKHGDKLANIYSNKLIPLIQSEQISIGELPISDDQIIGLLELIDSERVSSSIAYQRIFPELIKSDASAEAIAERLDLLIATSEDGGDELETLLQGILDANEGKVKAYRSGKKGLLGFFMGQAMKESGGKLNPKSATEILQRLLDNQ